MKLDLISWNLDGNQRRTAVPRMQGTLDIISGLLPDLLFLQELVEIHRLRMLPQLGDLGYFVLPGDARNRYFCAIAYRTTKLMCRRFARLSFSNSMQDRELLTADLDVTGPQRLHVATSHLESTEREAGRRGSQHVALLKHLAAQKGPTLFAGDTNLDEQASEGDSTLSQYPSFSDAWEGQKSQRDRERTQYTIDSEINRNHATRLGKQSRRRRPDRCLVNSEVDARHMRLLGRDKLPCGYWPSDHFGLYVAIELQPAAPESTAAPEAEPSAPQESPEAAPEA